MLKVYPMTKNITDSIPERFFTLVSGFKTYSNYHNHNIWLYFSDMNLPEEESWSTCIKLAQSPQVKEIMGDTFCVLPLYPGTPYYYPRKVVLKEETVELSPTYKIQVAKPTEYVFEHFDNDAHKSTLSDAYDWNGHRDPADKCLAIVIAPDPLNIMLNLIHKTPNKQVSIVVVTPTATIQIPDFNATQLSCVSPYKFLNQCSRCVLLCPTAQDCFPRLLVNDLHSYDSTTKLDFSDAKEQWKPGKTQIEDFTFRSPMYTAVHSFTKYKRPITQHSDLTAEGLREQRVTAQKSRMQKRVRIAACQTLECVRCFIRESCEKLPWPRATNCEGRFHQTAAEAYDYIISKVENPYTFKQTMTLLYNSGGAGDYNRHKVHASLDLIANQHIIFGLKYIHKPPQDPNTKRAISDPFVGKHPLTYNAAKKLLTQLNGEFLELPKTFYPWVKRYKKEALAVLYETLAIERLYRLTGWGSRAIFPISVSMRALMGTPRKTTTLDMAWTLSINSKRYSGGLHPYTPQICNLADVFKLKNYFQLLKQVRYIPNHEQLLLF